MITSIDNLREITRRCLAGEPLPPTLSNWLGESLDQFLSRQQRTIDDALGLHWPRGGIPWWMEEAMRLRDAALRELARRFYPELSISAQAREIHRLALRYASSAWLREQNAEAPPAAHEGTPLEWLWAAFKAGAAMPIGVRQLRHVLGISYDRSHGSVRRFRAS